jgi:CheY-like chemotaxis protein
MDRPAILVVDDDADIREAITLALEMQGFRVLTASNGQDCLRQLRGDSGPSLVLLDLMMPRMNGWEVCAEMAADPRLRDMPVVVLTGGLWAARDDLPVAAFLRKPIDLDTLVRVVGENCKP